MNRLVNKVDNYIKNTLTDMRNCNEKLTYKNILSWIDKDELKDIADDEDLMDMIDASIEMNTTRRLQASDKAFGILFETMADYVASTFDIQQMIDDIVDEATYVYDSADPDVGIMSDGYELDVDDEMVQEEIEDDILEDIDYNDLETFVNDAMSEEDIIEALENDTLQYCFEDSIDEILYRLDVKRKAQRAIENRESELWDNHESKRQFHYYDTYYDR